jgi:putative addiction module CopG family antidote
MPTFSLELPEDLHQFVKANVGRGGFASASEYIAALVDAARNKRSEIEAALIEGLDSGPAEEWTSEEWANIKQRVIGRHEAKQ